MYVCIVSVCFPKEGRITDHSKAERFSLKGLVQSSKKKPKKAANYIVIEQNALSDKHPKMTGQNDRPDESLTGQAHYQAGHCPLTDRYFETCLS